MDAREVISLNKDLNIIKLLTLPIIITDTKFSVLYFNVYATKYFYNEKTITRNHIQNILYFLEDSIFIENNIRVIYNEVDTNIFRIEFIYKNNHYHIFFINDLTTNRYNEIKQNNINLADVILKDIKNPVNTLGMILEGLLLSMNNSSPEIQKNFYLLWDNIDRLKELLDKYDNNMISSKLFLKLKEDKINLSKVLYNSIKVNYKNALKRKIIIEHSIGITPLKSNVIDKDNIFYSLSSLLELIIEVNDIHQRSTNKCINIDISLCRNFILITYIGVGRLKNGELQMKYSDIISRFNYSGISISSIFSNIKTYNFVLFNYIPDKLTIINKINYQKVYIITFNDDKFVFDLIMNKNILPIIYTKIDQLKLWNPDWIYDNILINENTSDKMIVYINENFESSKIIYL